MQLSSAVVFNVACDLLGEDLVGIGLIMEVLTCAPEELGPSERMVLVVIAEDARDATRESWALKPEELGRRAGLKPAALQKVFQRLSKAGLEVRVPLKVGKDGRPVYAYEGKKCTYRLPKLKRAEEIPPSEDGTESALSEEAGTDSALSEGRTDSALSSQEGGTESCQDGTQSALFGSEGGTGSSEGGTGSAPTPHYPSTSSSPSEKKKGGAGGRARRASRPPADEHPRFDEWYAVYPLHKARGAAVKAFNTAVRTKHADPDDLIAAAKVYAATKVGTDPKYIAHPATWLNQDRWLDEQTSDRDLAATGTDGPVRRRTGALADVNNRDWSGWAERGPNGGNRR